MEETFESQLETHESKFLEYVRGGDPQGACLQAGFIMGLASKASDEAMISESRKKEITNHYVRWFNDTLGYKEGNYTYGLLE